MLAQCCSWQPDVGPTFFLEKERYLSGYIESSISANFLFLCRFCRYGKPWQLCCRCMCKFFLPISWFIKLIQLQQNGVSRLQVKTASGKIPSSSTMLIGFLQCFYRESWHHGNRSQSRFLPHIKSFLVFQLHGNTNISGLCVILTVSVIYWYIGCNLGSLHVKGCIYWLATYLEICL